MQKVVDNPEPFRPQVNFGAELDSNPASSRQLETPIDEDKMKKYAEGPKFVQAKKKKKKKRT